MIYYAAIFLPLLSFLIVGAFGKRLGDHYSGWLSTTMLLVAAVCGGFIFKNVALGGEHHVIHLFDWLTTPTLSVSWALKFDTLSALMIVVVTSVSAMVHMYSIGYMQHDPSLPRFMAYLGLFTFFMLMLVTASNLMQLFFGWEGVGLASYLLIGFWYERESANAAAMKAFVVNRVGDVSFALGLFLIYVLTGSLDFDVIFSKLYLIAQAHYSFMGLNISASTLIALLLFGGAMGKSAQLGLHVWLPDAMEGPTPVSALIHAATMVTAGVFMLVRMSALLEQSEVALMIIACVGAATALFAGTVAVTQNDIKRVIAYSTCSQLGYMFFAIGMCAYHAAMFHLFTHAFFKALLFLGAGSVIHAMSDEQDMQKMGGIWKFIPVTYGFMWIGTLALTGFPLLSGYFSKDLILESTFANQFPIAGGVYAVGILAAALTALYSWRLMFLTFHGAPRADDRVMAHIHESPLVMIMPLCILALGSLFAGGLTYPLFTSGASFWGNGITILPIHDVHEAIHHLPLWAQVLPLVAGLFGFVCAITAYIWQEDIPSRMAARFSRTYQFLYNKWYFDELYERFIVNPTWCMGMIFWKSIDQGLIDPYLPDGAAGLIDKASFKASRLQSGIISQYAVIMLLGLVAFTLWQLFNDWVLSHG